MLYTLTLSTRETHEWNADISKKVEELHPRFVALTQAVVGKKRVGLQMYDGDKLTEEYTMMIHGYLVTGYETGIKDPFVTMRMQEHFLNDFVKQEDFIVEHPILARLRYFPVNALKGNIRLGRKK